MIGQESESASGCGRHTSARLSNPGECSNRFIRTLQLPLELIDDSGGFGLEPSLVLATIWAADEPPGITHAFP